MLEDLVHRLNRVTDALQKSTRDADTVAPRGSRSPSHVNLHWDFNENRSPEDLANTIQQVIHAIASLKDHFKSWCRANNTAFTGDDLVNSNKDVAIVHDLWNKDKHAELKDKGRSGLAPRIDSVRQVLRVQCEPRKRAAAYLDPKTMRIEFRGSGQHQLVIHARVIDEHGRPLGDLLDIAGRALGAWTATMKQAGVPI